MKPSPKSRTPKRRSLKPALRAPVVQPRISLLTLGITDLARSRAFYEALGYRASSASQGDVVFFHAPGGGAVLALYPVALLAEDAQQPAKGSGFRKFTLAWNVPRKTDVSRALKGAERAGATIVKPAQDVFWGGHSGYFADPDGHLWEVAWNPFFKLGPRGQVILP